MRVIVVGAGIAGLSFATCMQRRGHEVLVVEKSPSLRGEGYMIDFFGSGYDAAERLGLLGRLEEIHYPIPRLTFVDEEGRTRVSVSYVEMRKIFDDRHFNFMRGDLEPCSRRDVFAALARHHARIAPSIVKKQKAGRSIARWFVPEGRASLFVRDAAMRMSSTRVGRWVPRRQIAGDSIVDVAR